MATILSCGSRHWRDVELIDRWMAALPADTVIIHGGQVSVDPVTATRYGADYLVEESAKRHGIKTIVYRADWNTHGKAAGPIRNERMLDEHPEIERCRAWIALDPDGDVLPHRGTHDCLRRARKRGIPVDVQYETYVHRDTLQQVALFARGERDQ